MFNLDDILVAHGTVVLYITPFSYSPTYLTVEEGDDFGQWLFSVTRQLVAYIDGPTLMIPPVMFDLWFLFLLIGVEDFVFTIWLQLIYASKIYGIFASNSPNLSTVPFSLVRTEG